MIIRIKNISRSIALALGLMLSCGVACGEEFDPYSASIEENIAHPSVASKYKSALAEAMAKVEGQIYDKGLKTTRVRSGEVVVVTIPASVLFGPNATELKENASRFLAPLTKYVENSKDFKTIIAVHADDTGDKDYSYSLTEARANAIDSYFLNSIKAAETGVIPYGLGKDEPLKTNVGITNRAANRRVEIYLVPTEKFVENLRR